MPVGRRAASRCRRRRTARPARGSRPRGAVATHERAEQRGEQREAHDRDRRSCPVSRRRHARMPPPHSRRGPTWSPSFSSSPSRESGRRAICAVSPRRQFAAVLRALTIRVSLSVLFFCACCSAGISAYSSPTPRRLRAAGGYSSRRRRTGRATPRRRSASTRPRPRTEVAFGREMAAQHAKPDHHEHQRAERDVQAVETVNIEKRAAVDTAVEP